MLGSTCSTPTCIHMFDVCTTAEKELNMHWTGLSSMGNERSQLHCQKVARSRHLNGQFSSYVQHWNKYSWVLGQNARSPSSIRVPNLCVVNDAPATCSRVDQTTRADWSQRLYLTGHLSLDYVARQVTFHQNQRQEQHQPSEVCSSKGGQILLLSACHLKTQQQQPCVQRATCLLLVSLCIKNPSCLLVATSMYTCVVSLDLW